MMDQLRVDHPGDGPCLTTGHKMYLIGGQDGMFPERGEHLPKEMWGLWAPPIKVADGFWFALDGEWLDEADAFEAEPYGCSFEYEDAAVGLRVRRFQFVPQDEEGLVLRLTVENTRYQPRDVRVKLAVKSDLLPVAFSGRIGKRDGEDSARCEGGAVFVKDEENPWCFYVACSEAFSFRPGGEEEAPQAVSQGNGAYFEMESTVSLEGGSSRTVVYNFASSSRSPAEARRTLAGLEAGSIRGDALLGEKQAVYQKRGGAARMSFKREPLIEQAYRWTQYINDWVVREVPGVGMGAVAGYAEYPRWFGHSSAYSLPALLLQGDEEICRSTLRLIRDHSGRVNGNGRVAHEISANGTVLCEGMTSETPQFADTVWRVYRWTGDADFLREMYPFCRSGMEWVDSVSEGGLPRGYGGQEIEGLDCLCCDTAAHAARGYQVLALMAGELGRQEDAERFQKLFGRALRGFQEMFWVEELGDYGDMAASREEIMARAGTWQNTVRGLPIAGDDPAEDAGRIRRDKFPAGEARRARLLSNLEEAVRTARGMGDGERRAFCLFDLGHCVFPIVYGFVEPSKADKILRQSGSGLRPSAVLGGGVMPVSIGRRIAAEARAGRPEAVLESMRMAAGGFGRVTPGATSEIYPGSGCFVQAWNSFATMWPAVDAIFGLEPDAARKSLVLHPCACDAMDGLSLENVRIGGERFDFCLHVRKGKVNVSMTSPSGWTVQVVSGREIFTV